MNKRLEKFLNCPHKTIQQFSECCLDCGENIWTTPEEILKQEQEELEYDWDDDGW